MDFLPGPELHSKTHLSVHCKNTLKDVTEKIKSFDSMFFITYAKTLPDHDDFYIRAERIPQSKSKIRDYYMHSEIERGIFVGHIDFELSENYLLIDIISYNNSNTNYPCIYSNSEIFFHKLSDYLRNVLTIKTASFDTGSVSNPITPEYEKPWEIIPDQLWYREAIKLWHQCLTYKQIGNRLDLSQSTIKNKISSLRKEFGEIAVPFKRNIRKY